LTKQISKPPRDFFDKSKMKKPFDADIFMGKLLKWMVKTDQPFSIVDNEYFQDLLEYLKTDLQIVQPKCNMKIVILGLLY
jgi:hypothetical protein